MTGRTSKNSKKTEVGKSASASAKAKKKGANGAKVSKYNEKIQNARAENIRCTKNRGLRGGCR